MAERKTGRKPPVRQGGQTESEAVSPGTSSPTTQPRLTLPSLPKVAAAPSQRLLPPRSRPSGLIGQYAMRPDAERSLVPIRSQSPTLPQTSSQSPTLPPARAQPPAKQPVRAQKAVQPPASLWDEEASAPTSPTKAVTLIPGKPSGNAPPQQPGVLWRARHAIPPRVQAAMLFCVLSSLALALVFGGVLKNGLEPLAFNFSTSPLGGVAFQPTVGPTLPPGLDTTSTNYYVNKYGFDPPGTVGALAPDEQQRLKAMLPSALAATARYDARYQAHVEPEMLLWWTHAEGIGARINYSNCANEAPPAGQSFFSSIMNCDRPDFWQLGYGNQFGNIWVLKDAFTDMHGNPNDPALVQKVGQAVLDYDISQHTTPDCGGYACTFPAMTIDQIMADVHWHASDHKETTNNWWASVLSRDPGINSYMLALALTGFSHEQTKNWIGCYYVEPCWQGESNALWQVLAAWKSLGG